MKEVEPHLYASTGFTIDELVKIYQKYCLDLNDPEEIWIRGYDEFLFYRSDIEIRKNELTNELSEIVVWCDYVVLRNAYNYLEVHEHGVGLLDDAYREKNYPLHHWWWYVDRIHNGFLQDPIIPKCST